MSEESFRMVIEEVFHIKGRGVIVIRRIAFEDAKRMKLVTKYKQDEGGK